MMKTESKATLVLRSILVVAGILTSVSVTGAQTVENRSHPARPIGEVPAVLEHLDQGEVERGKVSFAALFSKGRELFTARFTKLDGQGRPAATGNGTPTKRDPAHDPGMLRTSGPDSSSCAGCHNQPSIGGAGDFVANVFVLAQNKDPVVTTVDAQFSNERNTLGMYGAGPIEMLAREMTADLQTIRAEALAQAAQKGVNVASPLITKGVTFGSIVCLPVGTCDTTSVVGVDADLVIRPFHQKGVVVSLREFSNNAFNHHSGLESVERFGAARTGTNDFDEDGVIDELTVGDLTAAAIFQAFLPIPGQVIPSDKGRREAVKRGEISFSTVGCATCHVPSLVLDNPVYSEPNPYNPPGNLRQSDVTMPVSFDLTKKGPLPRLERTAKGTAIVRAFTDLKRHAICDESDPFFRNELLKQGGVPTDVFLTRKLWDVGNSAPYGHRGDLATISEAILHHAGEAKAARDAYVALGVAAQADIIEFLKSLQVLPDNTPRQIGEESLKRRGRAVDQLLGRLNAQNRAGLNHGAR